MEATTRWRSFKAASFFDEQFDAPTDAESVTSADALVGDVEEGRDEGVVVEKL